MRFINWIKSLFGIKTPPANKYLKYSDVVYGVGSINNSGTSSTKNLLMDVYHPPKFDVATRYPAVICIHGGGFKTGDKRDPNLLKLVGDITENHFVCFSINYRLRDDDPPAPISFLLGTNLTSFIHAAIVDTKCAIRHIVKNAEKYNIDPDKIFVLGESAGAIAGNGAALTKEDEYVLDKLRAPKQDVNNYDVTYNAKGVISLWGNGFLCLNNITKDSPPILIIHGTKDVEMGASYLDSLALYSKYNFENAKYTWVPIVGAKHGPWDKHDLIRDNCLKFLLENTN
jgi:predicted esterase